MVLKLQIFGKEKFNMIKSSLIREPELRAELTKDCRSYLMEPDKKEALA